MSEESIIKEAGTVAATVTGTALADTVYSTTSDVTAGYVATAAPFLLASGSWHDLADAVIDVTFASAPAANKFIYLYRRDMNIKGANDAPIPSASNRNILLGAFELSTDVSQTINLQGIDLSRDCTFFISNAAGVTLNSWGLDIIPHGYSINP